ncbi:aminodeoxychorismate lyase [Celerinatantimonas sp. YJH-8]|uniref:aminodeoxychorismate lyase n=1 Tax=Celerinatantimonas sp. YJH-8 TaxID=3228714 RepID=UPI0038CBDE40
MYRIWTGCKEISQVPVADRGLMFGDGFFTTMAVRNGQIHCFELHCQRIRNCANQLSINLSYDFLLQQLLCYASAIKQGGLKLIITRGQGGQGYQPSSDSESLSILSDFLIPEHYTVWQKQGIRTTLAKTKLAVGNIYNRLKTLNRLEQVALKQELFQYPDTDDLIVCDHRGYLTEAIAANIFWRKGNDIFTPDLSWAGIEGVMRSNVLKLLKQLNIHVYFGQYTPEELNDADEIFLTNSLMPIIPVHCFNAQNYSDFSISQLLLQQMGF